MSRILDTYTLLRINILAQLVHCRVSTLCLGDCGFNPWQSHTKGFKSGTNYSFTWCLESRARNQTCLDRCLYNVTGWDIMCLGLDISVRQHSKSGH